jgi:hypothetical protein
MVHDADDTKDAAPKVLDLDESETGSPAVAPAASGDAFDLGALMRAGERWGYVDEEGAIHIRAGRFNEDRIVARVPPSRRVDTLANLLLRFREVEEKFADLRKQLRRSKNLVRNLKSLQSYVHWVEGFEAIGDYDSILGRAHTEISRIESRLAAGRAAKLELVERAERLADSNKWKSTAEALDELMQEWKCAGSAGREQDEVLWQRFSGAQHAFFTRRNKHFAELKRSRAGVHEVKKALIARAEELAPSTDYEGTFADMQALLDEWKQAGSAGRDIDDGLWDRFHAAREPFFARRRTHIAEQRRREISSRGPEGGGAPRGGRRGAKSPAAGRPRGGDPGVLRSSLADRFGPLKDLFPAKRSSEDAKDRNNSDKGGN